MSARWDPHSLVVGPQPPARRYRDAQQRPPGLDPIYRWAEYTQWRGFARVARWHLVPPDQRRIQVIVQAPAGLDWKQLQACPALWNAMAPVYQQPLPGQPEATRHFTATLPFVDHQVLIDNPLGLRWKLAMPLRDAQLSAEASPNGLNGPYRDGKDMQAHNVVARAVTGTRKAREKAQAPDLLPEALAVIDFGCPFLHVAFHQNLGTRVRALWDQGSEPGQALASDGSMSWPWDQPTLFRQGRELRADMLDAITQAARATNAPDEANI
jgi:hypothetical protein